MKKTLLILCGAFLALTGFSQKCLTDQMLEARFEQNPGLREEAHRFMVGVAESEMNVDVDQRTNHMLTIPVVVHILHDNGQGNISEEQVKDGLSVLNIDINKLNADTSNIREVFKPFAANTNVQFKLAKIDPDGFCTNGITRHNKGNGSYEARDGVKRNSTGGVDAWATNKYFNIWVVNSIAGSGEGITLGYAQFPYPGFGGINATYGIVARQDYFGTIGTSNDDGRMMTHEIGHCLGLLHTFQGGCSTNCTGGGDYVCDTPPVSEPTYGCSFSQNTCTDPLNDPYAGASVEDQIENFMSYDACTNMFSEGQKVRMRDVLTNGGGQTPTMLNLTSEANLTATGVNLPGEPCQVIFEADKNYTCINTPINFSDFSFSKVSSWSWSFPGGTPATSDEQNPTVSYDTPGSYDVILTIGDSNNTVVDSTYTDFITITADNVEAGPYQQGFESGLSLDAVRWYAEDRSFDGTWQITNNAGSNSSRALFLNNSGTTNFGSTDVLISDAFDLSSLSDGIFAFDQCYAMKSTNNTDRFKIEISNDCGVSWTSIRNNAGVSVGPSIVEPNGSFFPQEAHWRHFFATIPSEFLVAGVKFRLTFTNGGGNNFFLDNLNITSTVGLLENSVNSNLAIFPNPFSVKTSLVITSSKQELAKISILDMYGKETEVYSNYELRTGENTIDIIKGDLPAGVYLLQVSFESGRNITKKLIIK